MEDDAKRMPAATQHLAHAMAEIYPIRSDRPGYRSVMDGERHRISLVERRDRGTRLHARALLGYDEFPTSELAARRGEKDRDLQRKDVRAIEILMQAVIVTSHVLQQ